MMVGNRQVRPQAVKPVGFLHQIVENDDGMRSYRHIAGRGLLVVLTFWALAMIIPDFYRLYQPLGSFGFYANNDGVITDVQGPFLHETDSPAFQAGLRMGDRLDLRADALHSPQHFAVRECDGRPGRFSPRCQSAPR
jgi:hypothetical protein